MIKVITLIIEQAKYEEDLYKRINEGLAEVGVKVVALDGFQLAKSTIEVIKMGGEVIKAD